MKTLHVDIKDVLGTVSRDEINKLDATAAAGLDKVLNGTGAGSDFLGWVNLPTETTDALLDDIIATAESLRRDCDTVVAIGIGGSYLGAKAVIEALSDSFAAYRPAVQGNPKVLFADEPTGALNRHNTTEVLNLLTRLNREGQSILMVTHDMKAALRAGRLLYLEDGKITGELTLPEYNSEEEKSREMQVTAWLNSLEW